MQRRLTMNLYFILMAIFSAISLALGDTNNKWQPNDYLLRATTGCYFELESRSHVFTQKQRYFYIVTLALSYYISNRENIPNPQRVHEAKENTRRELDRPTEVIGFAMQSRLELLRSIIDKPINDVKQSCPPNATQSACESSLQKVHSRNEQYCKGYMRNVNHYNEVVDLFQDKQIPELIIEINTPKKISDEDALHFFSYAANGKYSKLIRRMRDQYQRQIHTSYPCNALNVPAF